MSKKEKKRISAKNKKIINIASIILFVVFFVNCILLTINIFKLNMLPFKIVFLIFTIGILIASIFGFLILNKKIKWKIKIICDVVIAIMSVVLMFGNHYIDKTIAFFKHITSDNYEVENYYVLVLNDSKLTNEQELLDKKIGYAEGLGTSDRALEKLKEVVPFETVSYNSIFDLGNGLLNSEVEAIMLADYHKSILGEEIEGFDTKVKILYQFTIKKDKVVKSNSVDVTTNSFNVFLSGIDTYGEIDSVARSDVNMLITINPVTKQILLTSIPRDYYVNLSCFNQMDKLTHAGMYGIDCSIGTIEQLLDIDINYYIRVNFSSLINIVDVLDGINVYSEYDFAANNFYFQKGYNYMYGAAALTFSRARENFIDGDRQRGKNQQAVITAIVNKAMSPSILSKYTNILDALKDSFQTNMGMNEIQKLAKFQLDKMPKWNISSISVNGSDSEDYTYSFGQQKLYVMTPDQATVDYAKETIKKVMLGQDTNEVKVETGTDNNQIAKNIVVTAPQTTTSTTTTSKTNNEVKTTTTVSTTTTTMTTTTTTTTAPIMTTTTTVQNNNEPKEETTADDNLNGE